MLLAKILENVISQRRSEWWILFLACTETSKFSTSWYYYFGCLYPDMPKVPKIRSLHIYAISPEKHGFDVVLLPADKYKSFLQGDIFFDVCNQACPKYPKRQVCNIFAISQGKQEEWSWFFASFFMCYLAVLRPTLSHSQGDSLTNLMLITAFVEVWTEGHREPHNEVGSLCPAEHLASFDWEPSDSDSNALAH